MDIASFVEATIAFVRQHQHLAALIIFVLALGETLAFVSILIPSTAILIPLGLLLGAGDVNVWPLLAAGGLGATLGFTISYLAGAYFQKDIVRIWPFKLYPELFSRAESVFARYGVFGVFLGHMLGPVRPVIPIMAGVSRMAPIPFMIANVPGAFLWVTVFFVLPYFAATSPMMKDTLAKFGIL